MTGAIFDIQKFSIHDGPGIRTTVFFKGCPLRCIWCHNPEDISKTPLLSFRPDPCIGCGYCFHICSRQCHYVKDKKHLVDRTQCLSCGRCVRECYSGALELVGRKTSADEIMREVLKDKSYYNNSGGGLTLSGGEPLMQSAFAQALLRAAKAAKLHTCVETSGFVAWSCLERIRKLTDLFLYDIKETDRARHVEFTGGPNARILANLRHLHARGANIILRLPIIPGYNDRADHFDGIAAICRELTGIQGVEIMPYHLLGEGKLGRFNLDKTRRANTISPKRETIENWIKELRQRGINVVG